MYLRVKTNLE